MAALQAQPAELRRGRFSAVPPTPDSVELLLARRDALATRHAELLRELAELRAAEAFALAQADDNERETYLTTNRAALLAKRERLRTQLEQLVSMAAE